MGYKKSSTLPPALFTSKISWQRPLSRKPEARETGQLSLYGVGGLAGRIRDAGSGAERQCGFVFQELGLFPDYSPPITLNPSKPIHIV